MNLSTRHFVRHFAEMVIPSMLVAMLARRDEYTHRHDRVAREVTA